MEQNLAAGMDPVEARNAALRHVGQVAQYKDECRDARRSHLIDSFWEDARYAARNLRRDPFLAFAATLTLAVCIGANTTVFSVANSILIRPLPYPNSDRIDWISERSGPAQQDVGAAPDYFALREQNRIFEDVAALGSELPTTVNWTGVERPEQLDATSVPPSFFRVMGTQPLLGRYLAPDEEGPKAPPVAVLSYAFWRNRMGSDPHILGKTIALDRLPRTIVGVMPQGFDFPRGTQLWLPTTIDRAADGFPVSPTRGIFIVFMVARRKPGVTPGQAATEMNRLTFAIRALYPKEFRKNAFRNDLVIGATPLQEHLTGQLRPALLMLIGAVGLVLLIACANIANLLLARAGSRHRELAVRLALGSGRGRIIRQMLTESLVLAVPGGLAGIGLAWLAVHVLDATKPAILVRYPADFAGLARACIYDCVDACHQSAFWRRSRAIRGRNQHSGGAQIRWPHAQRCPRRGAAQKNPGGGGDWRFPGIADRRRVAGAQFPPSGAYRAGFSIRSSAHLSNECHRSHGSRLCVRSMRRCWTGCSISRWRARQR